MAIVYLSLGSNLGDRVGYLQQATSLLSASEKISVVATSSFYESEPWQMNSENWFVNAVIQISTTLTPEELLNECQRIENQLGRKRIASKNYIDRTLDIDILFYDDEILGITLPSSVALQIVDCDPAVRGDTVNKAMKNATLETGFKVKVPLFIENGETVLVRTDTGAYDGRAN